MRWTTTMPRPRPDEDPQRLRSRSWLGVFMRILQRRLATSFHAVRIARPGLPAVSAQLPLIVYCNHPSWWDAALLPVVVARMFPLRRAFAPIDAGALQRYRFMRRLGFFGIVPGSYTGASTFLRVARQILSQPDTVFCITPQGEFVDVRQRPVHLQSGLVALLSTVPRVTVLPLAVDYPFWSERTPEALVRFGQPRVMGSACAMSCDAVVTDLTARLTEAMDRLADDAISRDAERFDTLVQGQAGVGGVYDAWRRVRAWSHGERFVAAHASDQG